MSEGAGAGTEGAGTAHAGDGESVADHVLGRAPGVGDTAVGAEIPSVDRRRNFYFSVNYLKEQVINYFQSEYTS